MWRSVLPRMSVSDTTEDFFLSYIKACKFDDKTDCKYGLIEKVSHLFDVREISKSRVSFDDFLERIARCSGV
jgi:hypothetical protein